MAVAEIDAFGDGIHGYLSNLDNLVIGCNRLPDYQITRLPDAIQPQSCSPAASTARCCWWTKRRAGDVQPVYVSAGLAWEAAERASCRASSRRAPLGAHAAPAGVARASTCATSTPRPTGRSKASRRRITRPTRTCICRTQHRAARRRRRCTAPPRRSIASSSAPSRTTRSPTRRRNSAAPSRGRCRSASITRCASTRHMRRPSKAEVIRRGAALGVPFELTLSCMNPPAALGVQPSAVHCGECSKCRERHDAFVAARRSPIRPFTSAPSISADRVDSSPRAGVSCAGEVDLSRRNRAGGRGDDHRAGAARPRDAAGAGQQSARRLLQARAERRLHREVDRPADRASGFSPTGFARVTESELRVEPDLETEGDGGATNAKVVRQICPDQRQAAAREGQKRSRRLHRPEPADRPNRSRSCCPATAKGYTFTGHGVRQGQRSPRLLILDFKNDTSDSEGKAGRGAARASRTASASRFQ